MKTNLLTVSLLGLAFLGVGLVVPDASAGNLSLSSSTGPGYALVNATASGFQSYSNDYYNTGFYIDNNWTGQACPGSAGPDSAVANCTVPLRMPLAVGPHMVTARNPVPPVGDSANANYTVVAPSATIAPTCGPVGTPITVIGQNYPATYPVSIWFDGGFSGMNATADEAGNFTLTFPMPGYADGDHTIAVHGVTPSIDSTTFTITTNCVGSAVGPNNATVTHPNGTSEPLLPGTHLQQNDVVTTGAGGNASVHLIDNTQFTLGPNAQLTIDDYIFDPTSNDGEAHYSLLRGLFEYLSGLIGKHDDNVRVNMPIGNLGIRGTEFISQVDPCSSNQTVYLLHGELAVVPKTSGVTNICDGPVTIVFAAANISTSALAQATYDSLSNTVSQTTNPVSFAAWQFQYFGCTNNNPSAAADADPDGDGQNNMAEFLTGTDPTNSASSFHITSVVRTNNNLLVSWMTGIGRTNALQVGADVGGNYATNFTDIFTVTNAVGTTTNYLDVGGATNTPARYYRVRLVP